MNPQSNAMLESPVPLRPTAPAVIPATRRLYWSVRRELWEYRSIYVAPLAVAAVVLLGFGIATIGRAMASVDPERKAAVLGEPSSFAMGLIMATTFIVAVFYCLDALHAERRDRSILFWKSLPVSDLEAVLSKASIPIVVLPLLTFAVTILVQWIMLLLSSAVLLGSGLSVAGLWSHLVERWLVLLYHLVTIHGLWYAPMFGYLLLVSAWARRAPFLWAVLPPLALGVAEKIAFNTSHLAAMLQYRFLGSPEGDALGAGTMSMAPLAHLTPERFLRSPGLWIGLAVTTAFLAGAVRLRRQRGPM
jgi:ABC-2 type transport system permease protein